jgi:hypothetical protein
MSAAINFHHGFSWLNAANFANGIGQGFKIVNSRLERLWVWSQPDNVPATWSSEFDAVRLT